MLKQFITDYLSFTKKERRGIIVILVLIIVFTVLPFFFPWFVKTKEYDHREFEIAIATLKIKQADSTEKWNGKNYAENKQAVSYSDYSNNKYTPPLKGELFPFDPNTLSADGWKRLGLRDKTIQTILNYTSKGGKFRQPEDIGKIWGLHEDEVKRLLPYVAIPQNAAVVNAEKKFEENNAVKKTTKSFNPVDINTADTTAFIALPGIGSKLANRIISFRDKLGGFYSVEQVAETFALPDSTFQKIKPLLILKNGEIKRININTATSDEMKLHPYIRYNLATAIVQYRAQHGKFNALTDVKKIMMVTEDVYNKLAPYLVVE